MRIVAVGLDGFCLRHAISTSYFCGSCMAPRGEYWRCH